MQYLRYVTQHFRIKLFLLETLQTVRDPQRAQHGTHSTFGCKEQRKASCKYDLATRRKKQSQIDLIGGDSVVPSVGSG